MAGGGRRLSCGRGEGTERGAEPDGVVRFREFDGIAEQVGEALDDGVGVGPEDRRDKG